MNPCLVMGAKFRSPSTTNSHAMRAHLATGSPMEGSSAYSREVIAIGHLSAGQWRIYLGS